MHWLRILPIDNGEESVGKEETVGSVDPAMVQTAQKTYKQMQQ